MKQTNVRVPNVPIMLTAKSDYATFEQEFDNLYDYLVMASLLEEQGFKITSWYDKNYLAALH